MFLLKMKKFTLLLTLAIFSICYTKAQETVTLPYSQDFASLSEGNMESSEGSKTALRAIPTGIDTVIRGYEAGGVLKIGTRSGIGSITTNPVEAGTADSIAISFKAIPWTGSNPWPAKVTVTYGTNTKTIDIEAAPTGWPLSVDNLRNYSVSFPVAATNEKIIFATVDVASHDKRIFFDDLTIEGKSIGTSLTNVEQSTISIYPNPASSVAVLSLGSLGSNADVTIINISGKVVARYSVAKGTDSIDIDLSAYESGSYLVRIVSDNSVKTERLVVK